jgi:hypothetical protein
VPRGASASYGPCLCLLIQRGVIPRGARAGSKQIITIFRSAKIAFHCDTADLLGKTSNVPIGNINPTEV